MRRASHSVSEYEIHNKEEEEREDQEAAVVEEFQGKRGDAGEGSLRMKQKLQNQPSKLLSNLHRPWPAGLGHVTVQRFVIYTRNGSSLHLRRSREGPGRCMRWRRLVLLGVCLQSVASFSSVSHLVAQRVRAPLLSPRSAEMDDCPGGVCKREGAEQDAGAALRLQGGGGNDSNAGRLFENKAGSDFHSRVISAGSSVVFDVYSDPA